MISICMQTCPQVTGRCKVDNRRSQGVCHKPLMAPLLCRAAGDKPKQQRVALTCQCWWKWQMSVRLPP